MINLNFDILNLYDPKSLYVVDTSTWGVLENKPAIIEIVLPGEVIPATHYFNKKQVNIFNAGNLGITCSGCSGGINLPDGIYQIKIKGSPDSYNCSKSYLKSDTTRAKLDKYIASANFQCSCLTKEFMSKIQRINFLLEAADSNTRLGNFCEAQELLFKAQKDIDKLHGCKTCG